MASFSIFSLKVNYSFVRPFSANREIQMVGGCGTAELGSGPGTNESVSAVRVQGLVHRLST
jgi:hypothetical protein